MRPKPQSKGKGKEKQEEPEKAEKGWRVLHRYYPAHTPLVRSSRKAEAEDDDHVGLLLQPRTNWDGKNVIYAKVSDVFFGDDGTPTRVQAGQFTVRHQHYPYKVNLSINLKRRTELNKLLRCPAETAAEDTTHIKKPPASSLATSRERKTALYLLEKEATTCQDLFERGGWHPHIARFLGVVVEDDRITGIAYHKYVCSLNKLNFVATQPRPDPDRIYQDVVEGVNFLHGLGYCHNDLKPANICVSEEGRAVLIDFDSAMPTGKRLKGKMGTSGWSRKDLKYSEEANDTYSLGRIREWLDKKKTLIAENAEPEPQPEPEDNVSPTEQYSAYLEYSPVVLEKEAHDVSPEESSEMSSESQFDDVKADPDYVYESPSDDSYSYLV
jgi:serine/threonine protein kinase